MNSDHKVLEEVTLHPARCQVSCPALLSPWGSALIAVSAFHRHLWQRHLPLWVHPCAGHILLSCLLHHAGGWDEAMAKLLPEISINTFSKHNGLCKSVTVTRATGPRSVHGAVS